MIFENEKKLNNILGLLDTKNTYYGSEMIKEWFYAKEDNLREELRRR